MFVSEIFLVLLGAAVARVGGGGGGGAADGEGFCEAAGAGVEGCKVRN